GRMWRRIALSVRTSVCMQATRATFFGLPASSRLLVTNAQGRVEAHGRYRGHKQRRTYRTSSTGGCAPAAHAAAGTIHWRHPHEWRDLLVAKRAQLRHLGEQRNAEHGPNARHALQEVVLLAPQWASSHLVAQLAVQRVKSLVQPAHVLANIGTQVVFYG